MTAPYRAPLYVPGKATVQGIDPLRLSLIRRLAPLSLSLSIELSVFISLLPSHLSDLTVGGSPSEPPPVSVDFLFCRCSFPTIRRQGDWPQQIGAPGRGYSVYSSSNDKDKGSALEDHWVGEALFPPGRELSATFRGGTQFPTPRGHHGGADRGDRTADDCVGGRGQEPSTTHSFAAFAGGATDGEPDAVQGQPPMPASISIPSSGAAVPAFPSRRREAPTA